METESSAWSFEKFKELIKARLETPVVTHLYKKFRDEGLEQLSWKILSNVSSVDKEPLLYTLATHVTKEKPVFVQAIGKGSKQCLEKVKFISASTDLLWSLSLLFDDIVDKDTQRAGKDTAWVVYGREQVMRGSTRLLEILYQQQSQNISPNSALLLQQCIEGGIKSLFDPRVRSLDSTEVDILRNIDQRARFHCEYPVKAIFEGETEVTEEMKIAIKALYAVNRAGQVLNDVKDLIPSNLYGRCYFSDIKGGTVTLPLRMMVDVVSGVDKKFLGKMFGQQCLDSKSVNILEEIVKTNLPTSKIHQMISDEYDRFLAMMSLVVSEDELKMCQEWVEYKMLQADKLLRGQYCE